ncbi:outer membrane protein assembly factor BamA [Helicobacter sp. T3_23-1059]
MPNIFYHIKVIAKIIARFSLFAVFFTFFSAFFSLASADSANNKITSIRYEGLQSLSAHLASEIADIKVGEALDEDKIDSAITDFYDQGYFSDIVAGFENGVLTFYFVEKPRVAGIEIKGYGSDNEKQTLQTQMGIKKGETFDEQKIERAKSILKTVLEYQGYYGSLVKEELTKVNEGAYNIVFNVNRGENILIKKAHYEGSQRLKRGKIESLSANKQRDFMGWMWGLNDGKLHLQELEYDSMRIQDVYMRNGFLDAKVSSPFLSANFNNLTAELHYKIDEGKQYSVSDIIIDIDKEGIIEKEKLQKAVQVKKGQVFNIEDLRYDAQTLKRLIADKGYAFAQVRPDLDKDEGENALDIKASDLKTSKQGTKKHHKLTSNKEREEAQKLRKEQEKLVGKGTVKVLYHIEAGEKVYISDVLISGNNRTNDRIIRREILLAPGDEYSLSKITESQNALQRLGFFENVKIDERRVSADSMDLLITVTEGRTGQLQFGLGYGSYGGLMINGSISERNLFGTGQTGSIYANIATGGTPYNISYYGTPRTITGRQFSGNISLTNPRIFDSRYSTSASLYGNYYVNYVYIEQSFGLSLSVGRMLTPTLRTSLGYDINWVNTFDFIESTRGTYEAFYKWDKDYTKVWAMTSSLSPSISFDNTDDYYFPKNGIIASAYAQFNGIGGDVRNIKLYGKAAFYYHLKKHLKIDLIARYKAQGGYIFRFDRNDFLPLNNTFYMGGVTTIRGFRSGTISPIGYMEGGGNLPWVGGDGMFTNSVELSYGLLEAAKMRVALYGDYGFLTFKSTGRLDDGRYVGDFKGYGIPGVGKYDMEWRASIGAAIEWISPMGPIVLIFPFKLFNKKEGDYTSQFEFSMGTRF